MPTDCIAPSITPYPLDCGLSPNMDRQPTSRPASSWTGKRLCRDVYDKDPNCCCDGYSIESVIDQSREYGLGEHPEVKKLEAYPCITCLKLDSIMENLAMIAWANESEGDAQAKRLQELNEMSTSINAFEQADELDNR